MHSALPKLMGFARRFGSWTSIEPGRSVPAFALEGPMLGSFGGTPERGVWAPTREEWLSIASCGALGLAYVVISPDAWLPGSHLNGALPPDYPDLRWVIETLVAGGVRPALGHFSKSDPVASAAAVDQVVDIVSGLGDGRDAILTDHLFNDMPVRVPYAWRTPDAIARRHDDLARIAPESWTVDELEETIGPVPATLIRHARAGRITACMNFDGEHVDTVIARRAAELIGPEHLVAMTDRTDVPVLGGQHLHHEDGTELWYQQGGIVAAGSRSIDWQRHNMAMAGIDVRAAWSMAATTPARILGDTLAAAGCRDRWSVVSPDGSRSTVLLEDGADAAAVSSVSASSALDA